ncbi:MAG: hypothetical protein AAGK10_02670 [Cyanobacteria bacterium J06555_3]
MRNIKYRTIFLSLALVALSFFLVAKVAVNFDANGDRQAATTINSDLSEAPVPNPRRQNNNNLDELYQQAAAAQPDLARLTQEFADRFGGEALIPETLKARQRAEEKIAADYGGDATSP